MTFWELIKVLWRYWYLVVIGAVCTVAVGLSASSQDGVYFTRTTIAFRAPTSELHPNSFRTQSEDVIDTAGVVAKRVTGPGKVTKFSTPDVTIVGLGVLDGWSLRLPDTGGQWATNFSTQALVLDVVGPSPEIVRARQQDLIGRVQSELLALQDAADVKPSNHITAVPAPDTTVIYYVTGSRPRVLAMTAILGICVTVAIVLAVDRRRRSRHGRQSEPADRPTREEALADASWVS